MTLFRRTLIAATAAAAFAAPFASFAQDIKPRIIRFGYGLNEISNQGRATKVFADEVEKASGGKMKIRAIGAAALGSDVQMQQALIGGAQEMMVGSTATLVGITKEMAIWDTPFLFDNAKEADVVIDGPVGQKVMDKLQEKGLVGLLAFAVARRRSTSVLGGAMQLPTARHVDRRLVLGSLVFGAGWGLAGFCPGPALVSMASGETKAAVFVAAMVVGMLIFGWAERSRIPPTAAAR